MKEKSMESSPLGRTAANRPKASLRTSTPWWLMARPIRKFTRSEDGSLIIFSLFLFVAMMVIVGLSVDLMRFETTRTKLQNTVDRAALAGASLSQTLDPSDVVSDYFAKSGMSEFLSDVTVTEGLSYRRVDVETDVNVPTHFFNIVGVEALGAPADGIAEEAIGNVEISLVLDVSGSMNSHSRLANLKVAAKDFVDAVYDASQPDYVSFAIIPYATQVNAGETLLSHYNRADSHERSHCINFASTDFDTPAISTTQELEQTLHFDPWTDENDYFDLGEVPPYPVCPGEAHREIMPWSTDRAALKDYIDDLTATGNTSTDIGMKWGAALVDPSTRSVLTSMIASGDVGMELLGRPYDYNSGNSMKVIVVMTDGAHTSQYYMGDHREGLSFVWRWVDDNTGDVHYSIWWDGDDSTPITNPTGQHTYCDQWDHGTCLDWDTGPNPEFWFHAVSYDGITNTYGWRKNPYDGNQGGGNNGATQMTWPEVWAEIPPEYFSDEVLYEMESLTFNERNTYEWAIDSKGKSTKDSRFDSICEAVKDEDVIVFSIGLEVSSSNASRLASCATTPSHYYDVDNLDIGAAFQSIASQINQLRLVH